MCNFASMIITRKRVRWLPNEDSHEEIVDHYRLKETVGGKINFVRVELLPQGEITDLDNYTYKVDQDVLPEWYVAEVDEARARKALVRKVAANKVTASALAEYDKVTASASAEYNKVTASALAEYVKVTAPARAEYNKVTASARAEYDKVTASALAEYVKVTAPARAEYDKVTASVTEK